MVAPSISLFKVNLTLNFKPWIFYSTSFEWLFSSFLVCTVACLASNNHDTLKHWEKTKELVTGSTHVPILDITLRKFFLLLQYEVVAVWPDWAIDWTFDNFLKPLAAINLPNLPHSFVKVSKSNIFLVKSFLSNFYRHLVIFWSHWVPISALQSGTKCLNKIVKTCYRHTERQTQCKHECKHWKTNQQQFRTMALSILVVKRVF